MAEHSNFTRFVLESMKRSTGSRHWAADVMCKVAERGQFGHYPAEVTCADFGRALFWVMMNAPEERPLTAFTEGWAAEGQVFMPRVQAAGVLKAVAEEGAAGCFPTFVTCEHLGLAVHRIALNAPERTRERPEGHLSDILFGWLSAEREFQERLARAGE